jgi:hypothetical protein
MFPPRDLFFTPHISLAVAMVALYVSITITSFDGGYSDGRCYSQSSQLILDRMNLVDHILLRRQKDNSSFFAVCSDAGYPSRYPVIAVS